MAKAHRVMTDLRIVMLGKTGAGKSESGNTILRQKVFEEDLSSESVTKKCQQHKLKVKGRFISMIDTPGLFDTSLSKKQLKEEIVRSVEMSVPGPHVFLLVIRLDLRLTDEEKNAVKWIQENFGEEATCYTIILFTRGDQLNTSIEEFLTKNNPFKDLIRKCKGGYHVFDNTDKENQLQVTKLLEKIDSMVMENGGHHYTSDMYKKAQRKIKEEEMMRREEEERQMKEEEEKIRQDERRKVLNEAEEKRPRSKEISKKKIIWLLKEVKNVVVRADARKVLGAFVGFVLVIAGTKVLYAALTGGAVYFAIPHVKCIYDKVKDYKRKKRTVENNS